MPSQVREPLLLTPGPLTTSATVKKAMLHDWGSRDGAFIALNRRVRERLLALVDGADSHVCVPLQGSGPSSSRRCSARCSRRMARSSCS